MKKYYKLDYRYYYLFGDELEVTIGYFDSVDKAIKSFPSINNKDNVYEFSCCGFKERYTLYEFEVDERYGIVGKAGRMNTIDFSIKDDLKSVVNKQSLLYRESICIKGEPSAIH